MFYKYSYIFMLVSFHVAIGLMWCDVCVDKRDLENETREIILISSLFSFPEEESLRKIWIKFVNRKDWEPTPSSFICIKHFEEKYYRKGKNDKRCRLTKTLKPVSTIFNPNIQISQCSSSSHIISPVKLGSH